VNVDDKDTRRIQAEWERRGVPVPLTVIDSPFREITRPILDYVRSVRRDSPRDVVTVFIPEYVVGRWWENLLHNQSALRLKGRLLFEPGIMVTSVPWQLASTAAKNLDRIDAALSRGPARGPRASGRLGAVAEHRVGGSDRPGGAGAAGEGDGAGEAGRTGGAGEAVTRR
jgi:hypothetical protein